VVAGLFLVRRLAFAAGTILIAGALAAVAIGARFPLVRPTVVGAQAPTSAPAAMLAAADVLESKTAKGGPGYTFEIVQRSTMHARPGGPQIEIPDPSDRHKSLGFADSYEFGSLIERGSVTPAGFAMEMRTGPAPGRDPDWKAPYQFGVTTSAGKTFRNDGSGWYPTDLPPGIGLDPATAALLPKLLRSTSAPFNSGFAVVGDVQLPIVSGVAHLDDVPGIVAVDAAPFTELVGPFEYAIDAQGRLAQIHAVARNTRLEAYDLIVDTVITFDYPSTADPLPEPSPALAGPK
jgi:hypothetical protein